MKYLTDDQLVEAAKAGRITTREVSRVNLRLLLDGEDIGRSGAILRGRPWAVKKAVLGYEDLEDIQK